MRSDQKPARLGRYAIYFESLSNTIKERRKNLFGREAKNQVKLRGSEQDNKRGIKKLEGAVEKSENILLKSRAVFPFDLFPDTLTIDRQKLTVVHRNFFGTKQTVSVQHSDIKNIQADIGPAMGSLTVTSEHFINNTQTIKYLPKKDVLAIQQLVQGFIIAHNENIDTSSIDDDTLMKLLDKLGRGEAGERPVIQ